MDNEVEKAELIQSLKALLIPLAFFWATIVTSAGGFLLYNGYSLGYALIALGVTLLVGAFVAAFKFQNKLRAQGKYKQVPEKQSIY
jgi:hypothetical protein